MIAFCGICGWVSADVGLVQALDKGKGRENEVNSGSGDEGTESGTGLSDDRLVILCLRSGPNIDMFSNNSHRARQTRRRRAEREWTQRQRKEPGICPF